MSSGCFMGSRMEQQQKQILDIDHFCFCKILSHKPSSVRVDN